MPQSPLLEAMNLVYSSKSSEVKCYYRELIEGGSSKSRFLHTDLNILYEWRQNGKEMATNVLNSIQDTVIPSRDPDDG